MPLKNVGVFVCEQGVLEAGSGSTYSPFNSAKSFQQQFCFRAPLPLPSTQAPQYIS